MQATQLQRRDAARSLVLGTGVLLAAGLAQAGGGFTVPDELTAAVVSVGLVGAAVFAIRVGIRLYKWFAAAL